jgi:ubiquinol-cytochrome c reductase cytochrome c1 subunit
MKTIHRLLAAAVSALALAAPAAQAAGEQKHPEEHTWAFEGPFSSFDRATLQRGFQVYMQVCSSCHGMQQLSIRHLGMEGGPFQTITIDGEEQTFDNPNDNPVLRAIAADMMPIEDGPDEYGDMFERERRPSDPFPYPFANEQQARSANGGAYPPDLSVIVKARHGGAEYIRSLLLGYDQEPPEDLDLRPGQYYNPYMSGQVIAMPPQLYEGIVEYEDGTEATPDQMAHDIAAFLAWTSEPHMEARKRMGLMVMIYLLALAVLLYASYRQIWSKIEH